jgi:hypothetical protein
VERMLVAVFDNEGNVFEGSRALHALEEEGTLAIHGENHDRQDDRRKIMSSETLTANVFSGGESVLRRLFRLCLVH